MPHLSDTQSLILSGAAQRDNGSLYPLPATITAPPAGIAKSLAALIKRGLAEERETGDAGATCRVDGDLAYGIFITAAGNAAIGVSDGDEVMSVPTVVPAPAPAPAPVAESTAPRATKSAAVIALLCRDDGATLAELIAATGWLPHTPRAALTILRRKGHKVEKSKRGSATCYRITGSAA